METNLKTLIPFKELAIGSNDGSKRVVVVTHPGRMHMDEVMSVAIMKYLGLTYDLKRTVNLDDIQGYDYMLVIDELQSTLDHHFPGAKQSTVSLVWDWVKDELLNPEVYSLQNSDPAISENQWKSIKNSFIDPISITDMTGKMNPLNFAFNAMVGRNCESDTKFKDAVQWALDMIENIIVNAIDLTKSEDEFNRLPHLELSFGDGSTAIIRENDNENHFIPLDRSSSTDALLFRQIGRDGKLEWRLMVKDPKQFRIHNVVGTKFIHPNGFFGCFETRESALNSLVSVGSREEIF